MTREGVSTPSTIHTMVTCALHPRGRVHCVSKYRELGQLGADQSSDHGSCVQTDSDHCWLAIVGHGDLWGWRLWRLSKPEEVFKIRAEP